MTFDIKRQKPLKLKKFKEAPLSPATSLKRGVNEKLATSLPRKQSEFKRVVSEMGRT